MLVAPHAHAEGGRAAPVMREQEGSLADLLSKAVLQLPQDGIGSAHARQVEHQRLGIHDGYARTRAAPGAYLCNATIGAGHGYLDMRSVVIQLGNGSLQAKRQRPARLPSLCRTCTVGSPCLADAGSA